MWVSCEGVGKTWLLYMWYVSPPDIEYQHENLFISRLVFYKATFARRMLFKKLLAVALCLIIARIRAWVTAADVLTLQTLYGGDSGIIPRL